MTEGRVKCASIMAVVTFICASIAWARSHADAAKNSPGASTVTMMPVPPVRYFPRKEVEATFNHERHTETLFDSDYGSESFKVKASARTKLMSAEMHMEWTDVIYIEKGSATLVTGGRLANDVTPKTFPDGKPYLKPKWVPALSAASRVVSLLAMWLSFRPERRIGLQTWSIRSGSSM